MAGLLDGCYKNEYIHRQPSKDSHCYNLLPHTLDENHFHHPQTFKLALGTHTEWISFEDLKKMKFTKKKLLQKQNNPSQINSCFTRASDLKLGFLFKTPNFTIL